MKPINPIVALAGAAVVFAAGYAWGAAGDTASDPFLNTKLLASSNGVTYVDGPDADPPPWPAGASAPPPQARVQPASVRTAAGPMGPPMPAATAIAALASDAAPPDAQRVVPGDQTGLASGNAGDAPSGDDSVALNSIPSSALAPVYHPPAAPEGRRVPRATRQHGLRKQVSFGTMNNGQPVTIIWDSQ